MISIGFSAPNIIASVINCKKPGEFEAGVSILKNQKFSWDATAKVWKKAAVLYDSNLYDALRIITDVYFPEPVKQTILDHIKNLPSELIKENLVDKIDYSKLIKAPYKPVAGKHPFENFQDEDIRRAISQNRFLFNWEMGLGKSFATATIYEYLRAYKNVSKMILLTSRIGTYNLKDEMCKFCLHINSEDILVFNSPKSFKKYGRKIFDVEEVNNKKILIFSYDSWKLMTSSYGDKSKGKSLNVPLDNFFEKNEDKLICLDECHYLSNPKSDRSKSIFRYLKYFKYRYLFSATPADKYEKIYSVCAMLDPWLCMYLNYNDWINKYNEVGTWFSKYAINKNKWKEKDIAELNQNLARYSAKRVAKDVLDLPKYSIKTFNIDMSEKQKDLYKQVTNDIVNNCINKHKDMESASVDVIKEAFSTVMSFVENPNIIASSPTEMISDRIKEKCEKYNYATDYAKLDVVDAILEDELEKNQRGIVWYIHPKTKDVIIERYKNYNPIIISAEMSEEERDEALKKFKEDSSYKILIASQNILATSVTLIECSFAVYLEVSFSYGTYLQSTGRIYRIGQTKAVRVYHIWLNNSTDMFHVNAINQKSDLVNMLFSAKDKPKLSLKQMKNLFEGSI